MYWKSSWGCGEVFQPKMPYYAKWGSCPMKNSGMTLTFMWNLQSLCIHNLVYAIPLFGHGQGLVHSTCLTWDFPNTYHMFFHEAVRSVSHRRPIKVTSTPVQQPEFRWWTMRFLLLLLLLLILLLLFYYYYYYYYYHHHYYHYDWST